MTSSTDRITDYGLTMNLRFLNQGLFTHILGVQLISNLKRLSVISKDFQRLSMTSKDFRRLPKAFKGFPGFQTIDIGLPYGIAPCFEMRRVYALMTKTVIEEDRGKFKKTELKITLVFRYLLSFSHT